MLLCAICAPTWNYSTRNGYSPSATVEWLTKELNNITVYNAKLKIVLPLHYRCHFDFEAVYVEQKREKEQVQDYRQLQVAEYTVCIVLSAETWRIYFIEKLLSHQRSLSSRSLWGLSVKMSHHTNKIRSLKKRTANYSHFQLQMFPVCLFHFSFLLFHKRFSFFWTMWLGIYGKCGKWRTNSKKTLIIPTYLSCLLFFVYKNVSFFRKGISFLWFIPCQTGYAL